MKQMKKYLCLLLAAAMLLGLVPAFALEAPVVASGTCGPYGNESSVTWTLTNNGVLTISGAGDMKDYWYYGDAPDYPDKEEAPWYTYRDDIVKVIVTPGVTSIGGYAFGYGDDYDSLTEVEILGTVTRIGMYAFFNCDNMTTISLPNSLTYVEQWAFTRLYALTDVYYEGTEEQWNRIVLEEFNNFSSHPTIHFGNKPVVQMQLQAENTTLSWTEAVYNGLWQEPDVTVKNAYGATLRETVDYTLTWPNSSKNPGNYTVTVTGTGNFYTGSFTMEYAILENTGDVLASGEAGNGLTWSVSKDFVLTISGTGAMKNYDSPIYFYDADTLVPPWYDYGEVIEQIVIGSGVTYLGEYAFHANIDFHQSALEYVTIPLSVTRIGEGAFYGCSKLAHVYYAGKETDRADITIGSDNDPLENAAWHYENNGPVNIGGNNGEPEPLQDANVTLGWTESEYNGLMQKPAVTVTSAAGVTLTEGFHYTLTYSDEFSKAVGDYTLTVTGKRNISGAVTKGYSIVENTSGILQSGVCGAQGSNLTWAISTDNVLTISGTGAMEDYDDPFNYMEDGVGVIPPWFDFIDNLEGVVICNGVTSIGEFAFCGCYMDYIVLPVTVTKIGMCAFQDGDPGDFRLNDVYYAGKETNRADITIGSDNDPLEDAAWHYENNGPVNIGGNNGEPEPLQDANVTLSWTESEYNGLVQKPAVTVTSAAGVTLTEGFHYTLTYSDEFSKAVGDYTLTVTGKRNISGAVTKGYSIVENTSGILQSGVCGAQGSNLTWAISTDNVLTISGTGAMEDYDDPFNYMEDGVGVIPPWFDFIDNLEGVVICNGVTSIGEYAFCGCCMDYIVLPVTVTKIGMSAFDIYLGVFRLDDVYYAGKETNRTDITIGSDNDHLEDAAWHYENNGPVNFGECGADGGNVTWSLRNGVLTISGIGEMADYGITTDLPWYSKREDIKSVIISEGVTSVGDNAFSYCPALEAVSLPNTLTAIGENAFRECEKLDNVVLPSSLTSCGNSAFSQCSSLTGVTIPAGLTAIPRSMFNSCTSLSTVTISEGVESIARLAFYNTAYKNVVIPASLTAIENRAFVAPDTITVAAGNPVYIAKNNCLIDTVTYGYNNLVCGSGSSVIPLDGSVDAIGYDAFESVVIDSLTVPYCPEGVSSQAFEYCQANHVEILDSSSVTGFSHATINELVLPANVTYISENAFYRANVNDVYFKGTQAQFDAMTRYSLLDANWHILGSMLTDDCVTLSWTTAQYNGSVQQPTATVKNAAGEVLTEGRDYTVTCPESVDPGSYVLMVEGINDYQGTVRKDYTIKETEALDAANVTRAPVYFYENGQQQQPEVTVKNAAGTVLTEGADYEVTYPVSIEPGSYLVRVDGVNGYTGTVRKAYTIKPAEALDTANITRTPTSFYENGQQQQPEVTVKNAAGEVLTEGVDYTVTYPESVTPGSYMVRIDGINGYKGTVRKAYTIKAVEALDTANITRTPTGFYENGQQQQPEVTVKNAAGKVLTEGADYVVTYPESIEPGSYLLKVEGVNGYKGAVRKAYTIKAVEALIAANVTRTPVNMPYTGLQQQPAVTVTNAAGKVLTEGTDYTVTYPESIRPGTYMVKVEGVNGYQGTVRKAYVIQTVELLDTSRITRTPATLYADGAQQQPTVTVKNFAGETLTEGVDYVVTWPESIEPGSYLLKVDGINGYTGTVRKAYTVKEKEALDTANITRTPTSFYANGTQQQPEVTVKNAAGKVLTEGTDYVVTYPASVEPGSYMVRIDGINGYKGAVRKAYTIKAVEALDTANITRTPTSFTANGTQQQPTVTVKNAAGKVLTEGTDYIVTYPTSVDPGTYLVRIDGINGYKGTVRKAYTIK